MSTLVARECDLADAVAATIRANWQPAPPSNVQRVWVANIVLNPTDPKCIQGRQVYVLPVTFAEPEWVTRAERSNQYTIATVIAERYAGDGLPPNEWVDEIVAFGERGIFFPLADPALALSGRVVTQAIPDPEIMPTVDVLVDRDRYLENNAVLIQYTHVFRDLTDYTGASS